VAAVEISGAAACRCNMAFSQAMTAGGVTRSYSMYRHGFTFQTAKGDSVVNRHCERSEAIHQAAKKEWIASLRSQ